MSCVPVIHVQNYSGVDLFNRLGRFAQQGRRLVAAIRARMISGDRIALVRLPLEWYQVNASMLRVEIDSENKTIQIDVRLNGQAEALRIRADGYKVVGEAGCRRVVCPTLSSPTRWLNVVLKTLRPSEKGVPLPAEYEDLIELVL